MSSVLATATYPDQYPCPTWEYQIGLTAHQRRRIFDCGWARQRRRFDQFRSTLQLTFEMPVTTFDDWANWVDKVGGEFFTMKLDEYNGTTQQVTMRFISPIQWVYATHDEITATITGETFGG